MFGSLQQKQNPLDEQPRGFMSKGEALRMVLMVAVLFGMLAFLVKLSKQLTATPDVPLPVRGDDVAAGDLPAQASPGDSAESGAAENGSTGPAEAEAASGSSTSTPRQLTRYEESLERTRKFRAERDALAEKYDLPKFQDHKNGIDLDLMGAAEDGTEEREMGPYFELLRWVDAREQAEIGELANTKVDLDWLRWPQKDVEEKLRAATATRGEIIRVYGKVLQVYTRKVEGVQGVDSPRHWVFDVYIVDRDRNVWLVIAADKDRELEPEQIVEATGPFFKFLKVETGDPDPKRRFKGFPTLVVKSLVHVEEETPRPGLFANPLAALFAAIMSIGLGLAGILWWRSRNAPPLPARTRSMLNNDRLRTLDKTKAGGSPSADAARPDAAAIAGVLAAETSAGEAEATVAEPGREDDGTPGDSGAPGGSGASAG